MRELSLRGRIGVHGDSVGLPDCGGLGWRSTMLLPKRLAG